MRRLPDSQPSEIRPRLKCATLPWFELRNGRRVKIQRPRRRRRTTADSAVSSASSQVQIKNRRLKPHLKSSIPPKTYSVRGSLVTIAMQGDFGTPRPTLVIQADQFSEPPSVTVLPVTSTLVPAPMLRVTIEAQPQIGLEKRVHVMLDKVLTVKRESWAR